MNVQFSVASFTPDWLLPLVYFDGNSLTEGRGSTLGQDYPAQTLPLLLVPVDGRNVGVSGRTTPQLITNAPALIDTSAFNQKIRRPSMSLVGWEGTNDLAAGASAATAYARLVTYYTARQAAGFKVVVVTLLPRTNGVGGSFEADRQTVNTNLKANWATFANAIADPGGDATIGPLAAVSNPAYYVSGVHLTNAGYAIVAGLVAAALRPLL